MRRRQAATGYSSNPPGNSGGGGSGGSSDQYFAVSDGTELTTSGKVTEGSSNVISCRIDDGQAAAVTSNGLSGLVGGMYWNLGSDITGAVNLTFEWSGSIPDRVHLCICVWRNSSAPTTLQDIENGDARWCQILTSNTSGVSTYLKADGSNLAGSVAENKTSSVSVSYAVLLDPQGWGGHQSRHYYTAANTTIRSSASAQGGTTGDVFVAIAFGKVNVSASSDQDISFKLRGGMPE